MKTLNGLLLGRGTTPQSALPSRRQACHVNGVAARLVYRQQFGLAVSVTDKRLKESQ
jgi:hypothetical protein